MGIPISLQLCAVAWYHHYLIEMNIQYNTVELCIYLHANSVYLRSYSALLHEGVHTKMKLLFVMIIEIMCFYD
jgi:hypothetical protein